ncbi:12454_t:CDS:2, partial [Funneliformis geosporum]
IHANESWADETEAEMSRRHDNKYQPSLFDSISTQLVNISQQLADIQNQLDIINNNKYKNPLNDMEEEDNKVVTAGIDISKSISNLSDNYEKLNNALVTVAQMQRLLVHHELLPENRLINITELIKLAPSDYFNDNKYDPPTQPKFL